MVALSKYVFETLREDGELVLSRGRSEGDGSNLLLVKPVSEHPSIRCLELLKHEYSLREELDSDWAVRPTAFAFHERGKSLVLQDPGGELLSGMLGERLEVRRFLRLAISLSRVLSKLHAAGLIHKNIKPANVLVQPATAEVWLTGFGIATRLPRERQLPGPPEMIDGTLAHMAPEQTGRMNRSIDSRSDLYSLGRHLLRDAHGCTSVQCVRSDGVGPLPCREVASRRSATGGMPSWRLWVQMAS